MEKEYLYEYAENALKEALITVTNEVSDANSDLPRGPMFQVANQNLRILKTVEAFTSKAVINVVADLLIHILKKNNIEVIENKSDAVDFCIHKDSQYIGYIVSDEENWFFMNARKTKTAGIEKIMFIVLQEKIFDEVCFHEPASKRFISSGCKGYVGNILLQDFLESFEINEFEMFKKFAQIYSDAAEEIVGINTAIVPNKRALEGCRKIIKEEFVGEEYLKEICNDFTDDEIKRLRRAAQKNIDILIGCDDFAKSFLSSEWYYNLQKQTNRGLEQTAIVAGYLKSVEQFVYSLIIAHSNRGRKIYVEHKWHKDVNGNKKKYPFNVNYKETYNLTLGALNGYMKEPRNKFFFKYDKTQENIVKFLEEYCKHIRNGYLHKDNIYKWTEINEIRNQTYCVYFLLLGYLYLNDTMREDLKKQVVIPETEEIERINYMNFSEWMTSLMKYDDEIGFNIVYFKLNPNKLTKVHKLEIMGMNSYGKGNSLIDENDTRTIPKIIRRFMYTPFEWKSNAEGEMLRNEISQVLERYLTEGMYAESLKKYQAVLVGDFKNIDIVYKATN